MYNFLLTEKFKIFLKMVSDCAIVAHVVAELSLGVVAVETEFRGISQPRTGILGLARCKRLGGSHRATGSPKLRFTNGIASGRPGFCFLNSLSNSFEGRCEFFELRWEWRLWLGGEGGVGDEGCV